MNKNIIGNNLFSTKVFQHFLLWILREKLRFLRLSVTPFKKEKKEQQQSFLALLYPENERIQANITYYYCKRM